MTVSRATLGHGTLGRATVGVAERAERGGPSVGVPGSGGPSRTIDFDALFNFRDLGGYPGVGGRPVRWRWLFRADALQRIRVEEAERFRSLGIRTVVDLRTPGELERVGRFPTEVADVDYHHLALFDVAPDWSRFREPDAPGFLADRYVEMLEEGRASVASALGLLARPDAYPLVFHCAAGKDRTGILAAIVLGLVGVAADVIVQDYALSSVATSRMRSWVSAQSPEGDERLRQIPSSVLDAHPHTMERFLAHLDETHGGAAGLVRDLGVDDAVVGRIVENVLEPA